MIKVHSLVLKENRDQMTFASVPFLSNFLVRCGGGRTKTFRFLFGFMCLLSLSLQYVATLLYRSVPPSEEDPTWNDSLDAKAMRLTDYRKLAGVNVCSAKC